MNTALGIVFNHRFDQNLAILRRIYQRRFPSLRFLVPGFAGSDPDVVPVMHNSSTFQGYFADALPHLRDPRATHYAFVADDLILARDLDATTLPRVLNLDTETGFIKSVSPLCNGSFRWAREANNTPLVSNCVPGIARYSAYLPPPEEFVERFRRHGVSSDRLHFSLRNLRDRSTVNVGGRFAPYRGIAKDFALLAAPISLVHRAAGCGFGPARRLARHVINRRTVPVPFATGYSDIVVIPACAIDRFVHLCTVFAQMGLWVEVAVPTALVLSTPRIQTERGLVRRGLELWGRAAVARFERAHKCIVGRLPQQHLWVHPVKLSRWELEQ